MELNEIMGRELVAGARTAIVSLWKVPSLETEEIFTNFYNKAFRLNQDHAHALRQAKLDFIKKAREKGETDYSPREWAAFVPLVGSR